MNIRANGGCSCWSITFSRPEHFLFARLPRHSSLSAAVIGRVLHAWETGLRRMGRDAVLCRCEAGRVLQVRSSMLSNISQRGIIDRNPTSVDADRARLIPRRNNVITEITRGP
jgi:hypothetical protein